MAKKINKVLLVQPNYAWMNKRTWQFPPYTLCLLKSCMGDQYETVVFDPNFYNISEEEIGLVLQEINPDLVAVTSVSTEYLKTTKVFNALIKRTLPQAIIVLGGVIPTVLIDEAMKDKNVDYWIAGEGERSLPKLIGELQNDDPDLKSINGLAYWKDDRPVINKMEFIDDLDALPYPDYSNVIGGKNGRKVTLVNYGSVKLKYQPALLAKKPPFAVSITSRGCPYKCTFCAGRTVSGKKVRFRSAENVLAEIDRLYEQGIREIIFLDDHFLADRKRSLSIMNGILERNYDLTWKCCNVTAWLLNEELLRLMYKSGCDFLAVSIESGNQFVLDNIIKKPIKLDLIPQLLTLAKLIGFDLVANFVVGFPGETWEQIRDTFRFAEKLDVDIVNFHIATPLPLTELMEVCVREKLLPKDYIENIEKYSGYGKGLISTNEFTSFELEVLRSFEWDRINFSSSERSKNVARMNGITAQELLDWRRNTRNNLGVNSRIENLLSSTKENK